MCICVTVSVSVGLTSFSTFFEWRKEVACFGVRVSVTFRLMIVHIIFSSVKVAEWPHLGKELLTRLTICSLRILTICNFSYFRFWF